MFEDRTLPFFRARVVLQVTEPVRLHAHHAATIYALLSQSNGLIEQCPPVLPDGVIPLTPEQCRVVLSPGSRYAFGMTLITPSASGATACLEKLVRGLRRIGRRSLKSSRPLSGNFSVSSVEDLVTGKPWDRGAPLQSIPPRVVEQQIEQARRLDKLTIRFTSPLRALRPRPDRGPGRSYLDRSYFRVEVFLDRLQLRLAGLGLPTPQLSRDELAAAAVIESNRLVWLDVAYGPSETRKSRDGAVGRIALTVRNSSIVDMLVLGQFAHLGEGTRWGLGGYHIEELGPPLFACRRSSSLCELAFDSPELDSVAEQKGYPAGLLRQTAQAAADGRHESQPYIKIDIPKADGSLRQLAIPANLDHALQRALHDGIAPGLDAFFEDSSLAYRKGLGRHTAAQRIRAAFQVGFRHAIRSDIHAFFDSVDHGELRERLDAFLSDESTVALIMKWVRAGSPSTDCGLPTGAPLSPLLANLFLDAFDEQIARSGARLIRYADDFLILFKSSNEATALLQDARAAALSLKLTLNEEKSAALDLNEPFEFLGFRFERRDAWEVADEPAVAAIEDLGWHEARRVLPRGGLTIALPGEIESSEPLDVATVIAGPGLDRIATSAGMLTFHYRDGSAPRAAPIDRVREVVVLGRATFSDAALSKLLEENIPVLFADRGGQPLGWLESDAAMNDADLVLAQAAAASNPQTRLQLARMFVASKLRNYAALASACPGKSRDTETPLALRELADKASAAGAFDELLGYEGAGAARWYAGLSARIDSRFTFHRRVAPSAEDPINAMLNLAFMHLHRRMILAARLVGLVPSIGFLHAPRAGHAALASDLQEPFRHLIERLVIEASSTMRLSDFERTTDLRVPLRLHPAAARRFMARLFETLAQRCAPRGRQDAAPYWLLLVNQARAVRRTLLDPAQPLEVFEYEPVRGGV